MLTLTSGTFVEDFFYGYPYDAVVEQKPPEFDYVGAALTSAGTVVCTPGEFTMHYGYVDPNPDIYAPYGGAEADNPYYMLFPVESWDQASGIFLTVTTTDVATLSFDRSFSGYVGDRLSVVVNGQERVSITGSAGYPWTSTTVSLGKGTSDIAIVLKNAPYSAGVVREGLGQDPGTVTDLYRYLRICNLQITNVAEAPTAQHQTIQMVADSSCSMAATVAVTSGQLLFTPTASLLVPTKTAGFVDLRPSFAATLADSGVEIGKYGQASLSSEATFSCDPFVYAHAVSDSGGFSVGTTASLVAENTQPQDISSRVRPLRRTSVKMTRPVVVEGRPQSPIAVSETEVYISIDPVEGLLLDKLDPYGPGNVVPDSVGGLTWRWLSTDAQRNILNHELTQWVPTDPSGPVWTTPGSYRPTVEFFTMRQGNQAVQVRYPSVQFDAGHLDHLVTTLPEAPVNGAMTWVFVGSFTRFRGSPSDSCPIIDYTQNGTVDYTPDVSELTAVRRSFPSGWVDEDHNQSCYFGLTSYGTTDQSTSRVAYRSDDGTAAFGRSDRLVVSDNTPVVIVYVSDGANSFSLVAPLATISSAPAMVASLPRSTPGQSLQSFTLGKSRVAPPFNGSFITGSMSLLEVAYANRALTQAQAQTLAAFYASLYAPVDNTTSTDFTTSGGADQDTEQCLIYAGDPETELTLISGNKVVPLGLMPSSTDGQAEIQRFRDMGVPIVLCSNRDYSSIVARLEN